MSFVRRVLSTFCVGCMLIAGNSSFAIPNLQLDTSPGTYDPVTQTTVATSNPFMLRALIDGSLGMNRTYYISAAIVPGTSSTAFGSFSIEGTTYSSSSGMQYGIPPVDDDLRDLQTHSIFPTWYAERSFSIVPGQTTAAYNVQDGSSAPGSLYYVDFSVNIAGLFGQPNSPYAVHFDLYTYDDVGTRIDYFAPYSHDAESGHGITIISDTPVPDGGATALLLGLAVLGTGLVHRRLCLR